MLVLLKIKSFISFNDKDDSLSPPGTTEHVTLLARLKSHFKAGEDWMHS